MLFLCMETMHDFDNKHLAVFTVHPSDFTRVDLTIPGEQYFYLRAINAAERQKWLVALGTAKACLTDNRTKREKGKVLLHFSTFAGLKVIYSQYLPPVLSFPTSFCVTTHTTIDCPLLLHPECN